MLIAICGSMQFASQIMLIRVGLEANKHVCIVPYGLSAYIGDPGHTESLEDKIEGDYIRRYTDVILSCDAIVVVNYEKHGISGYVGANTFGEMFFAHAHGKKIYTVNPIGNIPFIHDELQAMAGSISLLIALDTVL